MMIAARRASLSKCKDIQSFVRLERFEEELLKFRLCKNFAVSAAGRHKLAGGKVTKLS